MIIQNNGNSSFSPSLRDLFDTYILNRTFGNQKKLTG